jgi:hypothetical protein
MGRFNHQISIRSSWEIRVKRILFDLIFIKKLVNCGRESWAYGVKESALWDVKRKVILVVVTENGEDLFFKGVGEEDPTDSELETAEVALEALSLQNLVVLFDLLL